MMIRHDKKGSAGLQRRTNPRYRPARPGLVYQLAGAVILLVTLSSNAHAECMRGSGFSLTTEGPWNRYMNVQQGRSCSVDLHSGGETIFRQVSVLQSPAHGTVRLKGPTSYVYSASRGYTGDDRFMVKICGNYHGADSCTNVQYNVTVM
jgi:hypothetical protein